MPTASSSQPGRPPDPDITPRALTAARHVFARSGWAGFTMERVASEARIGKAALYRRWPTKTDLLDALFARTSDDLAEIDSGSFATDLREFVEVLIVLSQSDRVVFLQRAIIEAKVHPELFGERVIGAWRQDQRSARRMVERAIDRGEVRPDIDVGALLDVLHGMVTTHLGASTPETRARLIADPRPFAEKVTAFILHAFVAHPFRS